MSRESVGNTTPVHVGNKAVIWISVAFVLTIVATYSIIFWRLNALNPNRWCGLAKNGSPEVLNACQNILLALIDINGNVLDKMVILSGVLALCLAVVALRVNVRAGLPGGANVDIGADRTVVDTGDAKVVIPTPPSAGKGEAPDSAPWGQK